MTHNDIPIRTIIIDEDDQERACMRRILERNDIEVIGEAACREDAVSLLRVGIADAVVLDVNISGMSGFEVLDGIPESDRPEIIVVSHTEADAVRAFEYHAVDYVLKPCEEERFAVAVRKLLDRLHGSNGASKEPYMERIVVKLRDRIYFVRVDDIGWIEAAADYVHVHDGAKQHIVRAKIGDLERRLDPRRFVRIHRSTIVNLDRISELRPLYHGDYQVVLKDTTELTLSRGYRGRFSRFLMNPV